MSCAGSGGGSARRAVFAAAAAARRRGRAVVSRLARGTARARGAVAVGSASAMDVTPFRGAGDSTTRARGSADAVEAVRSTLDDEGKPAQRALVERRPGPSRAARRRCSRHRTGRGSRRPPGCRRRPSRRPSRGTRRRGPATRCARGSPRWCAGRSGTPRSCRRGRGGSTARGGVLARMSSAKAVPSGGMIDRTILPAAARQRSRDPERVSSTNRIPAAARRGPPRPPQPRQEQRDQDGGDDVPPDHELDVVPDPRGEPDEVRHDEAEREGQVEAQQPPLDHGPAPAPEERDEQRGNEQAEVEPPELQDADLRRGPTPPASRRSGATAATSR